MSFSAKLLDHFRNPRNAGALEPPCVTVEVQNPACGDILRLSVRIDNGAVSVAAFQVRGCTAAIAACSALTEWLKGREVAGLRSTGAALIAAEIENALDGLPAESKHAAVLAAEGALALARATAS